MKVTILGCGRWASFHAWYQAEVLKNEVLIWGLEGEPFASLARTRKNDYLKLPKTVTFTNDLGEALGFSNYIIVAIAAQAMPAFSKQISEGKPKGKTFVLCMKGIIDKTGERLSVVLSREVDKSNNVVIWVGPGHVQEFVGGQPNLMLIAGENQKAVEDVICKFKSHLIRLYEGDDLIGAEVGAAAKNVLGIMAGILDGAHLESLKGALMARGIYEVARLIVAMGGKLITAYGLSHLGDFQATLYSENSNNRKFGEVFFKQKGKHNNPAIARTLFPTIVGHCGLHAEGLDTSRALHLLAQKHRVDMPICRLCYEILHEGKEFKDGFNELFTREHGIKEFRF